MARTPSPEETPLAPELVLAAAVLQQARKDLHSPYLHIRSEAEAFWANPTAVDYWSDLTGIDLRAAQAHRANGEHREPGCAP